MLGRYETKLLEKRISCSFLSKNKINVSNFPYKIYQNGFLSKERVKDFIAGL